MLKGRDTTSQTKKKERNKMKTIAEIRAITQIAIEEKERKSIEACIKFIENVIEPNILLRAKNGYKFTFIDTKSLNLSQVYHIIDIYEEKGYKTKYLGVDDEIEICWGEEKER
jgi:hypothetical protein